MISGLPGSDEVATSCTAGRVHIMSATAPAATSKSARSSENRCTASGGRTESTDGWASSASTRGNSAKICRTRSIAATSSSALAPSPSTKLTWARFSPTVWRPDAVEGQFPTTEKTRSNRRSSRQRRSTRSIVSALDSSVVPSARRTRKANSPCERSGTRFVPNSGTAAAASTKAAKPSASTARRARSAAANAAG